MNPAPINNLKLTSSQPTEVKELFPRPKNARGKTLPKPSRKSKTESQLTNDPLWKDAFVIDGETGFVNEQPAKSYYPDAAGFIQLVENEYKAISDVDKHYSKSIPASAHVYYHNVIYWYRLALMAQRRGLSSSDQDKLVQFVQGYGSIEIAAGAADYLEGLGDYTDTTGVRHVLAVTEPNNEGHFGRASAETHSLYETLPAPAIFYGRVLEDLRTSNRGGQSNDGWIDEAIVPRNPGPARAAAAAIAQDDNERRPGANLRRQARRRAEEGAPDEDAEGGNEREPNVNVDQDVPRVMPTVNLLGWRPSRRMNVNQTMEIRGVMEDENDFVIRRYCLRRELFELVERRIKECRRYKTAKIPTTTLGSVVQQVTWRPLECSDSRFRQFIETVGVAGSRTNMPLRSAIAAKVMCYRAIRPELDDDFDEPVNHWTCFRFPDHVPNNWIGNRNVRVQHGNDGLISYAPFKTQVTPRSDTLLEYLNKFKAK